MVFEHIEKLKQQYTDKFVVVDEGRPELLRFKGFTGTVRTVNMSGRALVEFDALENIGWYDIDIDFLKVIDQPLPKPDAAPAKKPAAKAAAEKPAKTKAKAKAKAPSELEKARGAKPAEKPGAGMSVADVLAAARGESTGQSAPAAKKVDPQSMSVADMLAAARAEQGGATKKAPSADEDQDRKSSLQQRLEAARQQKGTAASAEPSPASTQGGSPAKLDPKQMSVAQMLAYARGESSGGAATGAVAEPAPAVDEAPAPTTEDTAPEDTAQADAPAPAAEEESSAPAAEGEIQSMLGKITSTEEILAYCRKTDGG